MSEETKEEEKSLLTRIEEYVETLTPVQIVYPNDPIPYYLRLWKKYVNNSIYGHQSSIVMSDVLDKVPHLKVDVDDPKCPPEARTSRMSCRDMIMVALIYVKTFDKQRSMASIVCREKHRAGTPFHINDEAFSDFVIVANEPDLRIAMIHDGFNFFNKWNCRSTDRGYEYYPVNKQGLAMFKYPYMVFIAPYFSRQFEILIETCDHKAYRESYSLEYRVYWFSNELRNVMVKQSVVGPSNPFDYYDFSYHMDPIENRVEDWKISNEAKELVKHTEYKKLTFLMSLHNKNRSAISLQLRGWLGERQVLALVLSFLPEIDV
jgi:hypothetical protein